MTKAKLEGINKRMKLRLINIKFN